ncbi:MAG: hypothetical protein OSB62_08515 [Alphaproteobacteria bacterium]|nr:hypothetical protein [Alphaproteobacteria bacterium]
MTKDKEILKESMKGKTKPRAKQTQINQHDNKVAVAGDATINIMEAPEGADDNRYDDSAERQGRRKLSLRHHGDSIDPKYMTPKEYRNFTGDIWDGIERRDGIYNWNAWDWDKGNKPVERRELGNRRKKKQSYKGKNKRVSTSRRFSDKLESAVYYFCFSFSFLVFLFFLIGALIKEGVLNV